MSKLENVFETIKNKFMKEIINNKKVIEALLKEPNYNGLIKFDDLIKNLEETEFIPEKHEEKNIKVHYNGNYEVTIYMLLWSSLYNKNLYLDYEYYDELNEILIVIMQHILEDLKEKNKICGNYKICKEEFLCDACIYVGDYFECKRWISPKMPKIYYNNYGYIKVYFEMANFKKDYIEMEKYAYMHNIMLDFFDSKESFEKKATEIDTKIIYSTDEEFYNKFKKDKKCFINKLPFDNYKFSL